MNKTPILTLLLALMTPSVVVLADDGGVKSGEQMANEAASRVDTIRTDALQQRLQTDPELVLVDIRAPGEIRAMGGTIASPRNVTIPRGWLEYRIQQYTLSEDTPIVVYCGANFRTPLAADTLRQMGYTNVMGYTDGYLGWRKAGLPTVMPAD